MLEQLKKWRRELHQIPELGLQEFQTAHYLRNELTKMGFEPQSIIETGTYVFIDYEKDGTIAFRCEMDGLEIAEFNQVQHKSQMPGVMHACGHDGHMSALLGFAQRLKESEDDLDMNVLLIFQPAEESPGGARLIVESGLLEKYNVKAIFGSHLMPFIDQGTIASKEGALMAMCGELDVSINGKSAHAGLPQKGIDAIVIASELIQRYQTIVSRNISPFQPVVLNIGKITGGQARNSIADQVSLNGTIRCYDEEVYQDIQHQIQKIHQGLEQVYHCHIQCIDDPTYPPVINDSFLYEWVQTTIDSSINTLEEAYMLSEDFSFYQKVVPGLFFFVGTKNEQFQSGLHTATFDFDEVVLEDIVELYYKIALLSGDLIKME